MLDGPVKTVQRTNLTLKGCVHSSEKPEIPTDPNTSTHWKFRIKILQVQLIPVTLRDTSENIDPNNGNILESLSMF